MKRNAASIGLALGLMAGAAHAVPGNYEIIQTQTFSDSLSSFDPAGGTYSPTTPRIATINPFSSYNTGSGTLNSVTIRWNTTFSFSGTTGSSGGNVSAGGGGSAYINSTNYNGDGDGGSNNSAPNSPLALTVSWAGSDPADFSFAMPYPSCCYSPAIATIFSGSSPFTVAFGLSSAANGFIASDGSGSWGTFTYSGIASGLLTANADVTVKYSYFGEQVPVPVPATAALLGLGLVGMGVARRKRA
jgi:hypothetical protein